MDRAMRERKSERPQRPHRRDVVQVGQANEILARLDESYPDARVELNFSNPLELLVATILSAQCTDKRVNEVTRTLFVDYPDARAYANADRSGLEEAIHSTGFFRQKTKNIQSCCAEIVERFAGETPDTMEELTSLAGVGRKTASVVLAQAYGKPAIAVDTHCRRVSQRLGLSAESSPDKVEADLRKLYEGHLHLVHQF